MTGCTVHMVQNKFTSISSKLTPTILSTKMKEVASYLQRKVDVEGLSLAPQIFLEASQLGFLFE